jgi:transposase
MINATMRAEMRRLVLGEHWLIGTVARRFGVHHSVVRRAISDVASPRALPSTSVVDPFKPYLIERLEKYPELTATRLLSELRELGFAHGIAVLRRFLTHLRGPRPRKAYLRVEMQPGEQAQVDWGSFGQMRVGTTQRPLSVFVMVLSWSRALYLDFSLDQRMETFCRMHQRAFAFFQGVPRKVLYDNLKTVVLHHIGSTIQFNPTFLAFAGHYLFEPTAAPVRYPEAKGRAEGVIKYIRHAFFYGRSFTSIDDVRAQAAAWRDDVANQRLHATTRERPADRLLAERPRLRSLPMRPADTDLLVPVIVSKEARVRLDTNTYSVPHRFVGRSVFLRVSDASVHVFCDDAIIAEHPRCWDRRRAIEHPVHIQAMLARRPGARGHKRRDRLASLSPQCRVYLQEVARRRINLDSEVRKLDRLVHHFGEADVAQAMAKALAARTFGARYVRALVDQSRFARGLGEAPEPIVTGNASADALDVTPHDLETYDALFQDTETSQDSSPDSARPDKPPADPGSDPTDR